MKTNTTKVETARKAALVIGAPLIGLAFVVIGPIAGLGALAWLAAKAAFELRFVRNATLFVAAPFIGLAYAFTLPFVGIAALAWVAFGARHA